MTQQTLCATSPQISIKQVLHILTVDYIKSKEIKLAPSCENLRHHITDFADIKSNKNTESTRSASTALYA